VVPRLAGIAHEQPFDGHPAGEAHELERRNTSHLPVESAEHDEQRLRGIVLERERVGLALGELGGLAPAGAPAAGVAKS
jgi:hypothetical protein